MLGETGPCAVRTCGDGPGEVGVCNGGELPSSSDEEESEDGRREWVGMEMGLECFTLLSDILVEKESSRERRDGGRVLIRQHWRRICSALAVHSSAHPDSEVI